MFHHSSNDDTKSRRVLADFKSKDGHIKCLIATVALGMDINLPNVDLVIHMESPKMFCHTGKKWVDLPGI